MLADRVTTGACSCTATPLIFGCRLQGVAWIGIAGAMNRSWMLAGVIKGWAHAALFETCEIERRPITEQASLYAMNTSLAQTSQQGVTPDTIDQPRA